MRCQAGLLTLKTVVFLLRGVTVTLFILLTVFFGI